MFAVERLSLAVLHPIATHSNLLLKGSGYMAWPGKMGKNNPFSFGCHVVTMGKSSVWLPWVAGKPP
jgi:di/tricarboxylate transporter